MCDLVTQIRAREHIHQTSVKLNAAMTDAHSECTALTQRLARHQGRLDALSTTVTELNAKLDQLATRMQQEQVQHAYQQTKYTAYWKILTQFANGKTNIPVSTLQALAVAFQTKYP